MDAILKCGNCGANHPNDVIDLEGLRYPQYRNESLRYVDFPPSSAGQPFEFDDLPDGCTGSMTPPTWTCEPCKAKTDQGSQ